MKTLYKPLPLVVYIDDSCTIKETADQIIITDKVGMEYPFPKGSYVFTKRDDISSWDAPPPTKEK